MKNNLKRAICALAMFATLSALTGCGTTIKAAKGYKEAFKSDFHQAQDFGIEVWTEAACLTSVDAVARNPKIVAALKELCPGLKESGLLDDVKPNPAKK